MRGVLVAHKIPGSVFVDYICVCRHARRQGVGRLLLSHISEPALLFAQTASTTLEFYHRNQFFLATGPLLYTPGFDDIPLQRAAMLTTPSTLIRKSWTDCTEFDVDATIEMVRKSAHMSKKACRRFLRIDDPNVFCILCP